MITAPTSTDTLAGPPAADTVLLRTPRDTVFRAAPDSAALAAGDSLGRFILPDSLAGADSLAWGDLALIDTLPPPEPDFRPASAYEVFGSSSIAVVSVPTIHQEPRQPLGYAVKLHDVPFGAFADRNNMGCIATRLTVFYIVGNPVEQ